MTNKWKEIADDLATALEKADLALSDWKVLQKPESYNQHSIDETHDRVFNVGAIAYIGNVKAAVSKALEKYWENESEEDNEK